MQPRYYKGSIRGRYLKTHESAIKTFGFGSEMMRNDVMTVCGKIYNFLDQSIINDVGLIVHGKWPWSPAPHISPHRPCTRPFRMSAMPFMRIACSCVGFSIIALLCGGPLKQMKITYLLPAKLNFKSSVSLNSLAGY